MSTMRDNLVLLTTDWVVQNNDARLVWVVSLALGNLQ